MTSTLTTTKTLTKRLVKVTYKNGKTETILRILWMGTRMARKEDISSYEFIEETIEY